MEYCFFSGADNLMILQSSGFNLKILKRINLNFNHSNYDPLCEAILIVPFLTFPSVWILHSPFLISFFQ